MKRTNFVAGAVCATAFTGALFACASNDEVGAGGDDAGGQTISTPATSDAGDGGSSAETGCTDAGCSEPVDCSAVDFCPVAFPVSRLTALNAVWGSGPNDVWAVGARGTILHGDGSTFSAVAPAGTNVFVSVWGTSASDVWVLDETSPMHSSGYQDGAATFDRRQGATWIVSKATTGRLWTGYSTSPDEVWLAGEPTTRFGASSSAWVLDSSDGSEQWQAVDACSDGEDCTPKIRSIWAAAGPSVFAVGNDGQAYHLVQDGEGSGAWKLQNTHTSNGLESVWGSTDADVWAVGEDGTILHTSTSGAVWESAASPTRANLHAVWGSGPADVWAAGDSVLLHFDGTSWTEAAVGWDSDQPATRLYGIWGSGADDVWIVGQGVILHRTAASRRHP